MCHQWHRVMAKFWFSSGHVEEGELTSRAVPVPAGLEAPTLGSRSGFRALLHLLALPFRLWSSLPSPEVIW